MRVRVAVTTHEEVELTEEHMREAALTILTDIAGYDVRNAHIQNGILFVEDDYHGSLRPRPHKKRIREAHPHDEQWIEMCKEIRNWKRNDAF